MRTFETSNISTDSIIEDLSWIEQFPKYNIFRINGNSKSVRIKNRSKDPLYDKPIIFINGYRSGHTTWNYLAQRLWHLGFRNIFALELKDFTNSLAYFMNLLDEGISSILELVSDSPSVSIISHSIGGIIARYYVKYNEKFNGSKVSFLMTIASPYYEIYTSLRNFGPIFDHIFPPEMIELFTQENGLYSMNNSSQPLKYNNITMVNVDGNVKSLIGSDGLFRPHKPCEMVNVSIPKNHFRIHKCPETYYVLKEFLCKDTIVFRVNLIQIKLNSEDFSEKNSAYFRIKDDKINQRFPASGSLKLSTKKNTLLDPYVIFTGKASSNRKEKQLLIQLLRKKKIFNEKILEVTVTFALNIDQQKVVYKKFENEFGSFSISILSYKFKN